MQSVKLIHLSSYTSIHLCMSLYVYLCNAITRVPACYCCLVTKSCPTLLWPHQAPLSIGFPRQEYWSRFPSPGDLPDLGIKPASPTPVGRFFTTKPWGKPVYVPNHHQNQDTQLYHHCKTSLHYLYVSRPSSSPIPNPWQSLICSPSW